MSEVIKYVQFEDWELGFLYDWVESSQPILRSKEEIHDEEFIDFLRNCSVKQVKLQCAYILNWDYGKED